MAKLSCIVFFHFLIWICFVLGKLPTTAASVHLINFWWNSLENHFFLNYWTLLSFTSTSEILEDSLGCFVRYQNDDAEGFSCLIYHWLVSSSICPHLFVFSSLIFCHINLFSGDSYPAHFFLRHSLSHQLVCRRLLKRKKKNQEEIFWKFFIFFDLFFSLGLFLRALFVAKKRTITRGDKKYQAFGSLFSVYPSWSETIFIGPTCKINNKQAYPQKNHGIHLPAPRLISIFTNYLGFHRVLNRFRNQCSSICNID